MLTIHTSRFGPLILVILLGTAAPVVAGPPLICEPFEAGNAQLLAWGEGPGWNTPSRTYDARRLTTDTMRLLTDDAPVIARMENLRRATIYAMSDPGVAHNLLETVVNRALSHGVDSSLAWFDAGYLIESYRQAVFLRASRGHQAVWAPTDAMMRVNGYEFVKKAFKLAKARADMEYAASLMTEGTVSIAHRQQATAGAIQGSLLARNLSK